MDQIWKIVKRNIKGSKVLFNDEFLKQFKSGDELNGFLKELQKRGI